MYRCLLCGSTGGTPDGEGHENWWWRTYTHGRVGPFCAHAHALSFSMRGTDAPTQFTLEEHAALEVLRQRYQEGR